MDLLAHLYEGHANTLKSGLSHDQYLQEVGVLRAYEEMATFADQVVLKLEELHDRTARSQRPAERGRAFLNDSHWNAPSGV